MQRVYQIKGSQGYCGDEIRRIGVVPLHALYIDRSQSYNTIHYMHYILTCVKASAAATRT